MGSFLAEIRRRGVLSVMMPYTLGAWLLIQIVSIIGPALSFPDWADTALVMTVIAGFPIALYFAWFFEFTEEGLRRTAPATSEEKHLRLTSTHWAGLGLTIALSAGLSWSLYDSVRTKELADAGYLPAPEEKSLAVMAFRDLSPDESLSYLSEGLADEIRISLGQLRGLKVAAMTSTRTLAEKDQTPRQVGAILGVTTLLEGTVRLEGNNLRVSATLLDTATGTTLWSDRYTRVIDDVFAMQEDISRAIANRLMDGYEPEEGTSMIFASGSSDAYVMYLKGREKFRERTTESIKEARNLFEQAIAFDPEYAPAHVGVADCVLLLIRDPLFYGNIDREIALTVAGQALDKALVRAPDLAGAWGTFGLMKTLSGDTDEAVSAFDKSLALNPSQAKTLVWQYNLYKIISRFEDAMMSLEKANALDPLSPGVLGLLKFELEQRNRLVEAREAYTAYLAISPDDPIALRNAAGLAYAEVDYVASARLLLRALEVSSDNEQYAIALANLFLETGHPELAAPYLGPDYEVNLAISAGDYTRALELARFSREANRDDVFIAFEVAWYEMLYGDLEKGRSILREAEEGLDGSGWFDWAYCSPHIELAFSLDAELQSETRAKHLTRCQTYAEEQVASGRAYKELYYLQARLAAIDGKNAEAIALLEQAYDTGWRQSWTRHDPLLRLLTEDERFQSIATRIEQDLAEQGLALDGLASGKIPAGAKTSGPGLGKE